MIKINNPQSISQLSYFNNYSVITGCKIELCGMDFLRPLLFREPLLQRLGVRMLNRQNGFNFLPIIHAYISLVGVKVVLDSHY